MPREALLAGGQGTLKVLTPDIALLNRMAICFGVIPAVLTIVRFVNSLKEPVKLPTTDLIALEGLASAKIWGGVVVVLTLALYAIFW